MLNTSTDLAQVRQLQGFVVRFSGVSGTDTAQIFLSIFTQNKLAKFDYLT
jgi:hypothetical protein